MAAIPQVWLLALRQTHEHGGHVQASGIAALTATFAEELHKSTVLSSRSPIQGSTQNTWRNTAFGVHISASFGALLAAKTGLESIKCPSQR